MASALICGAIASVGVGMHMGLEVRPPSSPSLPSRHLLLPAPTIPPARGTAALFLDAGAAARARVSMVQELEKSLKERVRLEKPA